MLTKEYTNTQLSRYTEAQDSLFHTNSLELPMEKGEWMGKVGKHPLFGQLEAHSNLALYEYRREFCFN